MRHPLQASPHRLKPFEPQQVHGCRPHTGQRPGTVAPEAMGSLMELGVADPVPALDTPAVPFSRSRASGWLTFSGGAGSVLRVG